MPDFYLFHIFKFESENRFFLKYSFLLVVLVSLLLGIEVRFLFVSCVVLALGMLAHLVLVCLFLGV